jgi:hypothetical protein
MEPLLADISRRAVIFVGESDLKRDAKYASRDTLIFVSRFRALDCAAEGKLDN